MPLLVHAVFYWVGGLFAAAFLHRAGIVLHFDFSLALLIPLAIGAAAALWQGPRTALAVTVTLLAVATGGMHWEQESRCITQLELAIREAASDELIMPLAMRLNEPLERDGFARGTVIGRGDLTGCTLRGSVRVKGRGADAGATILLRGSGRATQSGLSLNGEIVRTLGSPAMLPRLRARAGNTIDGLFGKRASLVRALLIADQDEISVELRDMYARSGLVHLLSVSGLHVAIIAEALLVVATALRLPATLASVASVVSVALYVLLLGAPPSAVRSAVMLSTISLSSLMQRPVHQWAALALGAAVPTYDPAVVVHLGWQLSVAGMASLVATRELLWKLRFYKGNRQIPRTMDKGLKALSRLSGWRRFLLREVLTGVIASTATIPIIAWSFGRVSLVAPLSNLAAGPIVGFMQPALFLALVLSPMKSIAQFVADAAGIPMSLLDAVASFSSMLPGASLDMAPSLAVALLTGLASLLFIRATAARRMLPLMLVSLAALVVAIWNPTFSRSGGRFELHMLDVGQGDALALRTPRGRWILMDAGRSWNGGDAGRRVVVPYLRSRGGELAAFILSHAHDDHAGGAVSVIDALRPGYWLEPAYISTTPSYASALVALRKADIPWRRVHPGDSLVLDEVILRILGPDSVWTAAQDNPNEASVVVMVEYRGVRFLLTGDAEKSEERWILDQWTGALDADVLKLGHHGSSSSSTEEFVDAVDPLVALASVGAGNRYGHPSPATLVTLLARRIPLLRTDIEGHISISTDGELLEISTRNERWTIPVKGR